MDPLRLVTSVAEMITFVCMVAHRAGHWRGRVIVYIGDNQNANGWIEHRRSGNPYARHLIRVLQAMEVQYGFRAVAFYLRSVRNRLADDLTRLPPGDR